MEFTKPHKRKDLSLWQEMLELPLMYPHIHPERGNMYQQDQMDLPWDEYNEWIYRAIMNSWRLTKPKITGSTSEAKSRGDIMLTEAM